MVSDFKPLVNESFVDYTGRKFDLVKEIAYKKEQLMGNLGVLVNETKRQGICQSSFSNTTLEGVYIYQSNINPYIAYRIYKQFADYGFNGYNDEKLIQKLLQRQDKIKLSKFPTGIISLEGKIIGQEIPYYPNARTLYDYSRMNKISNPTEIYIKILDILKELADNGILYLDNHARNYLIEPNKQIRIIDFEDHYVKIDDFCEEFVNRLFINFYNMVNIVNRNLGIDILINLKQIPTTFDDAYEQLDSMTKKLVK